MIIDIEDRKLNWPHGSSQNQIPYELGSKPVLLRCPDGHVCAVNAKDYANLGNVGSYFECVWCWGIRGKLTVLTRDMRTYKARWGIETGRGEGKEEG